MRHCSSHEKVANLKVAKFVSSAQFHRFSVLNHCKKKKKNLSVNLWLWLFGLSQSENWKMKDHDQAIRVSCVKKLERTDSSTLLWKTTGGGGGGGGGPTICCSAAAKEDVIFYTMSSGLEGFFHFKIMTKWFVFGSLLTDLSASLVKLLSKTPCKKQMKINT